VIEKPQKNGWLVRNWDKMSQREISESRSPTPTAAGSIGSSGPEALEAEEITGFIRYQWENRVAIHLEFK
jgi:hypothetical protein